VEGSRLPPGSDHNPETDCGNLGEWQGASAEAWCNDPIIHTITNTGGGHLDRFINPGTYTAGRAATAIRWAASMSGVRKPMTAAVRGTVGPPARHRWKLGHNAEHEQPA